MSEEGAAGEGPGRGGREGEGGGARDSEPGGSGSGGKGGDWGAGERCLGRRMGRRGECSLGRSGIAAPLPSFLRRGCRAPCPRERAVPGAPAPPHSRAGFTRPSSLRPPLYPLGLCTASSLGVAGRLLPQPPGWRKSREGGGGGGSGEDKGSGTRGSRWVGMDKPSPESWTWLLGGWLVGAGSSALGVGDGAA